MRGEPPVGFNWRDYSVMRIPYQLVPDGYMDLKTLARARQTTARVLFDMEYSCVFALDSDGFFRRSLIERCVVGKSDDPNPPHFASCGRANFAATLFGSKGKKCVMAIDPASEHDQFAIVIIEIWPDHRRIVFCWTTNKSDHRKKLKRHTSDDHDFYRYCARKVRELLACFDCEIILVDKGGGGVAVREALGDPDKLEKGEQPIYEEVDDDK